MRLLFSCALTLLLLSCKSITPAYRAPAQSDPNDGPTLDGGVRSSLAKFDLRSEMKMIDYTKFVVLLDANKKPKSVVFQNTNRYPYHSDYLTTRPEFRGMTRTQIDEVTVKSGPNRRMILGTIFGHTFDDPQMAARFPFSFELISDQLEPVETVKAVHKLLLRSSPETITATGYLASGPQRREILGQTAALAAVGIHTLDLYADKKVQVYVKGWTVGTLLAANADDLPRLLAEGKINRGHILVLDKVPREIPPVAGLLTAEPTASSSHVHLLAEMFGIPLVYHKDIMNMTRDLNGKTVALKAGQEIDFLQAVAPNVAARLLEAKKYPVVNIRANFTKSKIADTRELQEADLTAYGGKSVRMGLLRRTIPGNTAPHAVGIPVHYFKRFLDEAKGPDGRPLANFVNAQLSQLQSGQLTYGQSVSLLQEIRDTIKAAGVPEPLLSQIRNELVRHFPAPGQRLKLRSSSNVEDGAEFNGAGLYDSEGVWLSNPPPGKEKDFEKGLNKVWRSLYSDRGYLARSLFGIKESVAAMGILAQPPFKGEKANGVAIVKPKPQFSSLMVTVTGFPGEDSEVTNPDGSDQPEVTEVSEMGDNQWRSQLVQACSQLPAGRTLMAEAEYAELATLVMKVANAFPGGIPAQGLDYEWKLMEEGGVKRVILKQVRPMPKPRIEKFGDGSKFFYLGGIHQNYDLFYPEQDGAYGQFFCPEKVSYTMPSFSEKDLSRPVKLPLLEFELRGKAYRYTDVPLTSMPPAQGSRPEENHFALKAEVKSDFSSKHRFIFHNDSYESKGTLVTVAAGTVSGTEPELRPTKTFFTSVDAYQCSLKAGRVRQPGMQPNTMKLKYKIGRAKLTYEGTYEPWSPVDKTAHYIITKATLEGYSPRPIVVNVIRGATYAGEHHNFDWGFALDVAASTLSAADKEQVYRTHGRFFLLRGTKAAWLKDNRLSPLMEAVLEGAPAPDRGRPR